MLLSGNASVVFTELLKVRHPLAGAHGVHRFDVVASNGRSLFAAQALFLETPDFSSTSPADGECATTAARQGEESFDVPLQRVIVEREPLAPSASEAARFPTDSLGCHFGGTRRLLRLDSNQQPSG